MITFQTNNLNSRRTVNIDGETYSVRKMGNLETIEYNRQVRRLQSLAGIEAKRRLTTKESQEVEDISVSLAEMTIALFDDGGDQSKSRKLVSSLSEGEVGQIIALAFEEKDDKKA